MKLIKCPQEIDLERYVYGDLPFWKSKFIAIHLKKCPDCRRRCLRLERFGRMLSRVPVEEPPAEFTAHLMSVVQSWDVGDQISAQLDTRGKTNNRAPLFSLKIRWALGVLVLAIGGLFQWEFGSYFSLAAYENRFLGWHDLRTLWDLFRSGTLERCLSQFFLAFKTDELSCLEILGKTLPMQVLSAIVFGGIVSAVFIKQLRALRSGGDKR